LSELVIYSVIMNQDLGKHFIVGFSGPVLTAEERELWKKYSPLGCIIFKRNISTAPDWQETLRGTVQELKELSGRSDFIVSIDHEGGRVHRLTSPVTHFPAPRHWNEHAREVGAAMGEELHALGITLDFAPSFDLLVEPKNKVIGDRSFGPSADRSGRLALEFLDGLESRGVMGCSKHFPGHGGTVEDSHEVLPKVDTSRELLDQRELVPFRMFIESGRQLVMTAHVIFDSLDTENPATLSRKILNDLLRVEMGFQGAIITDALDMGALGGFSPGEVAEKFLRASGDLFCVCQAKNRLPIQSAAEFIAGLADRSNSELETELALSAKRIDRLLESQRKILASAVSGDASLQLHAQLNQQLRKGMEESGVV